MSPAVDVDGQTVYIAHDAKAKERMLHVEGRFSVAGESGAGSYLKLDTRVSRLMGGGTDTPRSRSDLNAKAVERVIRAAKERVLEAPGGHMLNDTGPARFAEDPEDLVVDELSFTEVTEVRRARDPVLPDHEDGWPEDGTATEKVKFALENAPGIDAAEIAAGIGCSRSLVSEVKRGLDG